MTFLPVDQVPKLKKPNEGKTNKQKPNKKNENKTEADLHMNVIFLTFLLSHKNNAHLSVDEL